MKKLSLFLLLSFAVFSSYVFSEEAKVVVAGTHSKDLKRTAYRLRIPVEQLKNARAALQEATDLARTIDPYPFDHIYALTQSWFQMNRPKAKEVLESFIHDLRIQASEASNMPAYQRATSTAMMLAQTAGAQDYDSVRQMIEGWPEPQSSIGEEAAAFRKSVVSQMQSQTLQRLAYEDPEKALSLLSEDRATGSLNYALSGQIAQGLMNAGKRDAALKIMDQVISDFGQSNDPQSLPQYESFLYSSARGLDAARAETAVNQWIAKMSQQPTGGCNVSLKFEDNVTALTCTESKALNFLQNQMMKPGLVTKTLEALPELKTKLDAIGGIDSLNGGGASVMYGHQPNQSCAGPGCPGTALDNPMKLIRELKGKAESNPELVRRKLRDVADKPQNIHALINLAMNASWENPELASLALEVAESLLPKVEPLQNRASTLQNLINGYRQIDGSVESRLIQSGFRLADQLNEESENQQNGTASSIRSTMKPGDQLESFLIAELSRDAYREAIQYARSIENREFRLRCFIQIIQAQQRN